MLADSAASASGRLTIWLGQAFLWWASVLQRTVAGRHRRQAHVARRNAAMRAAYSRGVDRDTITRTIGLSGEQVRKALRGEQTTE